MVLGMLAFTASAGAQTICVTPATGCDVSRTTIADAVSQTLTNAGPDTIVLGAAHYTDPVSVPIGEPVDVIGQGPQTVIEGAAGVLVDNASGGGVRDLTIRITGGTGVTALGVSGTADGVSIKADSGTSLIGVAPSPGAPGSSGTFRNGAITFPMAAGNGTGVAPGATGGSVTVEDSTIQAPYGVTGTGAVRRSEITAAFGVGPSLIAAATTPTPQYIEDTVIRTQAIAGYTPPVAVTSRAGFASIAGVGQSVVLRHDTIVGDGSPESAGILVTGTPAASVPAPNSVDARNVIVSGFAHSLVRTGTPGIMIPPTFIMPDAPANLAIAYSDFDPGTVLSSGPGTDSRDHNISADPRFADGDYRLGADSPAVDAGDPAGLGSAPAESATDRDGNPRIADGSGDGTAVTDIGAYELPAQQRQTDTQTPTQPHTPADPAPPAVSRFAMTNRTFAVGAQATAVSAGARKVKRGTVFAYTLSAPATVTITIAQKAKGFRSGRKCVAHAPKGHGKKKTCTLYSTRGKLTRKGAAGSNRVSFSGRIGRRALKPGSYRATIVAAGAGGNSVARTISFQIVRG